MKHSVSSLRDTLIKSQIDIEGRIQQSVSSVNDINKQLKVTVNSLRDELEKKDINNEEEISPMSKCKKIKRFKKES